jgi:hypothetical protein
MLVLIENSRALRVHVAPMIVASVDGIRSHAAQAATSVSPCGWGMGSPRHGERPTHGPSSTAYPRLPVAQPQHLSCLGDRAPLGRPHPPCGTSRCLGGRCRCRKRPRPGRRRGATAGRRLGRAPAAERAALLGVAPPPPRSRRTARTVRRCVSCAPCAALASDGRPSFNADWPSWQPSRA